ncbi:hypothetical protein [Methanobrevibacter sp.]|uniref:hypothetical protein n=1 Tax=Methanobrevibacter sp. TaxID=66852 RepID=UPI0026DF7027|nr:hypothetical protein [Methanobrevibacter sp.]MDO5860046.1 hypothetical protein [Methanobrevibacter sp.]
MTPQAQRVILQAINEVNAKTLYAAEEKGKTDGIKEGKKEATEELIRILREEVDIEILSKKTGLSVEEIRTL